jgi:hypothetical protein
MRILRSKGRGLKTIIVGAGGILTIWLVVVPDVGARPPKGRIVVTERPPNIIATTEHGLTLRIDPIGQRSIVADFLPSNRNPFHYGSRRPALPGKRTQHPPRPTHSAMPPRATTASVPLTLSGIARTGRQHTAIIATGAEIHLVTEGETFMGRYTAVEIGPEAVLIRDASGVERRLTFR